MSTDTETCYCTPGEPPHTHVNDDEWIDRSVPSWPREVHQEHIDADADHPVEAIFVDGLSDNCKKCGLATTSDGKRHGFDA